MNCSARHRSGRPMVMSLLASALVAVTACTGATSQAPPAATSKTGAAPAAAPPPPAAAGEKIQWKMLQSWDDTNDTVKYVATKFVSAVSERTGGQITITRLGPESVPPFEQLRPVRDGVFEALFTHVSYHSEVTNIGTAMDLVSGPYDTRIECKLDQTLDEYYQKKVGVKIMGGLPQGLGYRIYVNEPITKADLSGQKIRTSSFYDPMLKALNAVPVKMAFPEIYSALEKKVIDGAAWGGTGAFNAKWQEVLKYNVFPHFGETTSTVILNQNTWNKLSPQLQEQVTAAFADAAKYSQVTMKKIDEEEWTKLKAAGMQPAELKGAEADKWLKAFYDSTVQEFVVNSDPEYGPKLKATMDCVQQKSPAPRPA